MDSCQIILCDNHALDWKENSQHRIQQISWQQQFIYYKSKVASQDIKRAEQKSLKHPQISRQWNPPQIVSHTPNRTQQTNTSMISRIHRSCLQILQARLCTTSCPPENPIFCGVKGRERFRITFASLARSNWLSTGKFKFSVSSTVKPAIVFVSCSFTAFFSMIVCSLQD